MRPGTLRPSGRPPRQLRLLPWPRPLEERLGRAFFLCLPRRPGVYFMWSAEDLLLYVGKAVDLHQRLNSYRFLHGASRKTHRLVHAVHRITYEVHPDAESAVLRENQLLREHRPRFNRLNTWPAANCFVEVASGANWLEIAVFRPSMRVSRATGREAALQLPLSIGDAPVPTEPPGERRRRRFGAFPPGTVRALAAMGDLLHGALDPAHAPPLRRGPRPAASGRRFRFRVAGASGWAESLEAFFAGRHPGVLARIAARWPAAACLFETRWREAHLERLERFFLSGPQRLRNLRERFGLGEELISEALLDDLLARDRERASSRGVGYGAGRKPLGVEGNGPSKPRAEDTQKKVASGARCA